MKVSVKFKKHNYIFDCKEIQVCEDFRHYISIDNSQYRIEDHEFLKDAVRDERVAVYDRDYVRICFDSLDYLLGPFSDNESLITKDIVETINECIYRQFVSKEVLIEIDLLELLEFHPL